MTGSVFVELMVELCNDSSLTDNSEVVDRVGAKLVVGDGGS